MNWIRWNSPPIACARVFTAIVLARPGHALDEQVATREQGDDHALEQRVLADDDALDLVQDLLERRVECWLSIHCSLSHFWGTLPAPPAVPIGTAKPIPMK